MVSLMGKETKKCALPQTAKRIFKQSLLRKLKQVFACTTLGANKIVGYILPFRAGCDTLLGAAFCFIINITTNRAYILFHQISPFKIRLEPVFIVLDLRYMSITIKKMFQKHYWFSAACRPVVHCGSVSTNSLPCPGTECTCTLPPSWRMFSRTT